VLPVVSAVLRSAVRAHQRQGCCPGDGAGLQRLAYRRVVRKPPRPVHSLCHTRDLGPGSDGSRDPAGCQERLSRPDFQREPVEIGVAFHPLRSLGSGVAGM
jgi:hypothetical protein